MFVDIHVPCRTCLLRGGPMKDLFSQKYVPRLDEMLMSSTQLEVNPLDGLPKVICVHCYDKLYKSYMFKKMCQESEAALKKHSIVIVPMEQNNVSGEEIDRLNHNVIMLGEEIDRLNHNVIMLDIPALIKSEPSELPTTSDVYVDTLQDICGNGDSSENTDVTSRDDTLNEIIMDVSVRASRKKKKYECSKCNGKFKNCVQYQNHYCSDVRFTCTECNKSYASQVKLERHTKLAHDKDLNDSSDLTSIVSGLLEVKCMPEASRISDIKEEYVDVKDEVKERENITLQEDNEEIITPQEDNDEIIDNEPCSPGPSSKVSVAVSKKKNPPKRKRRAPDEQRLHCEHCKRTYPKGFPFQVLLVNHKFREHRIGHIVFSCSSCQLMFSSKPLYRRHRNEVHLDLSKLLECHDCGKKFQCRSTMEQHITRMHISKTKFACLKWNCKESFATKAEANQHKKVHLSDPVDDTTYVCDHCNQTFKQKYKVRRHILDGHMGILRNCFKCKLCKMRFNTRYSFNVHEKTHDPDHGLKKFLCTECGRGFKGAYHLSVHMARHRGEKNFKCQFCDKRFVRAIDRSVHEKYHKDTKTHLCTTCGKSFVRHCVLKRHLRTHTGEKPYQCTYCDWRCSQPSDLKAHIRRHTGERFVCEICSKDFLQGYQLKNHKLSAHGILDPKVNSRVQKVK